MVQLEEALGEGGKDRRWLAGVLLLTSTPCVFIAMHVTDYIFIAGEPHFSCRLPLLETYNWTRQQIWNISSPKDSGEECRMYDWNYTELGELGFAASLDYVREEKTPDLAKCSSYLYDEESPGQTIVSQWDLVCDDLLLKSTAQGAISFGKAIGGFIFGIPADRFGRKKIFVVSCFLFISSSCVIAFVSSYALFLCLRVTNGIACAGVYQTGYTILSELADKKVRGYLGCMFSLPYPVGYVLLSVAAYCTSTWRELLLLISLPTFLLLIHCWYLPESPRWLVTKGRLEMASQVLGRKIDPAPSPPDIIQHKDSTAPKPCYMKGTGFLKSFYKLFSIAELRKRILICYYCWFVSHLCYYVIVLNGGNFKVNLYLYSALNGLAEVPAFLFPIFILRYIGRRTAVIVLFVSSSASLLLILLVNTGWGVMMVAFAGRFSTAAVFSVVLLLTSELFPTEQRTSVIGSGLTFGQLGAIAAPYIVDLLSTRVGWYLPSTVCGVLAFTAALLALFLPETKDLPLTDTIREMQQQSQKL